MGHSLLPRTQAEKNLYEVSKLYNRHVWLDRWMAIGGGSGISYILTESINFITHHTGGSLSREELLGLGSTLGLTIAGAIRKKTAPARMELKEVLSYMIDVVAHEKMVYKQKK